MSDPTDPHSYRAEPVAVPINDVEITEWVNGTITAEKPAVTGHEVWDGCYDRGRHTAPGTVTPERTPDSPRNGGWRLVVRGRTSGGRLLRIIVHPVDVEQGK